MRSAADLLARPAPPLRDDGTLRWSRFLPATRAEGPGLRSALWVQGCSIRCPGCFNPHLWAETGATVDPAAAVAARVVAESTAAGVEGLTLLGGEPFDQAAALAAVAESVRDGGLTVMTFTGYTLDALARWAEDREDVARLLAATDLLVDGPYLRDRPDSRRPWLGSTNQGITALSPAYAADVSAIEADGGADSVEIRIDASGRVSVNGWADDTALASLLDDLGVRADGPLPKEENR